MNTRHLMLMILLLVLTAGIQSNAQVVINELSTDGTDYAEIANLGASAVDITGWTITMADDPTATISFTFPATTIIAPGEAIVIGENATVPSTPAGVQRFTIGNINWAANSGGACALNNAADVGQDLILFGNPTNIPTGSPLSPFTGSAPAGGGANVQDVFQRINNTDTDTPADWAMSPSGSGSPGSLNPGQSPISAPPTASFTVSPSSAAVGATIQFTDTSFGTPTSWMWDFNGDSIIDSTAQNPTFVYNALGTYTVSLTVSNANGSDTFTQAAAVNIITIPTVPFLDEFTGSTLDPAWSLESTTIGQIYSGAPVSPSPGSGGTALVFEATSTGTTYLNQATLTIDLSGLTDVVVKYWARESGDEADANDGLFVSDGSTTLLAVSHQNLTANWEEIELDLGDFVAANGMNLTSNFKLIFSQQDDFNLPSDGLMIDDVSVDLPPPADLGQANRPLSSLVIKGALNLNGNEPEVGENGPFFVTTTDLDITVSGTPNWPWILIGGPLNRNNDIFVPQGSLDVGLMGSMGNYSDIFTVMDGLNPVTFFDALATTGLDGSSHIEISLDNLPPGVLTTLQALVYQPNAPFVGLTAAFQITIP